MPFQCFGVHLFDMPTQAGDGLGFEGTVTASEVSRELWSLGASTRTLSAEGLEYW